MSWGQEAGCFIRGPCFQRGMLSSFALSIRAILQPWKQNAPCGQLGAWPYLQTGRISQAPICAGWCHPEQIQQIILNIADVRENPGRLRPVANLKAVKVKFIKETTNYLLHPGPRCRGGSTRSPACERSSLGAWMLAGLFSGAWEWGSCRKGFVLGLILQSCLSAWGLSQG